jgi:hypothetical protein
MTLARMRRRGALALAAGIILLLGVPLYQDAILARAGYLEAAGAIATHHQFGPYLLWSGAHFALDTGFRVVQLAVFVLALGVPGALRRILWPDDPAGGRLAMWAGQIGFALYAFTLLLGIVTTASAANAYMHNITGRAGTLSTYLALFAVKNALGNVLGGGLIAFCLIWMSWRGSTSGRMPGWLAYLGLATGGLLGASAIMYLFALTQSTTLLAPFALYGLAFWLIALGLLVMRVQTRPREEEVPAGQEPASAAAPAGEGEPLA